MIDSHRNRVALEVAHSRSLNSTPSTLPVHPILTRSVASQRMK
jgi:hypothetical protein